MRLPAARLQRPRTGAYGNVAASPGHATLAVATTAWLSHKSRALKIANEDRGGDPGALDRRRLNVDGACVVG